MFQDHWDDHCSIFNIFLYGYSDIHYCRVDIYETRKKFTRSISSLRMKKLEVFNPII